jgi:hypothetical protein
MEEQELSWLAGLLEGEGSFTNRRITVEMVDEETITRVAGLWQSRVIRPKLRPPWSQTYCTRIYGEPAQSLMYRLAPFLSDRRRASIALVWHPTELLPQQAPICPIAWLAGLLEGEGSFMSGPPSRPNQPLISVKMTDEDVLARIAQIVGMRYRRTKLATLRTKTTWSVQVKGSVAMTWMQTVYPYMSHRRRQQIDRAIGSYSQQYTIDARAWNRQELPHEIVLDIYQRACTGENYGHITADYKHLGVSRQTVKDIKNGRTWSWLTGAGKRQ